MKHSPLRLELVEPQPGWIESSGRWCWPLPKAACFPGCCTEVVTASREWWEYAPSEAKPHPLAEGVRLRDAWYWAIPFESMVDFQRAIIRDLRASLDSLRAVVSAERERCRESVGELDKVLDALPQTSPESESAC